jgi:endonuclease YncB( thermonuclease family)
VESRQPFAAPASSKGGPKRGLRLCAIAAAVLLPTAASLLAREDPATVTRVIDGDTIEVGIAGRAEKVPLIGVDTPETVDPRKPVEFFGKEASEFTRKLVEGKQVVLRNELGGQDRDKYGRLLRYVYMEDGTFVNAEIIKQGFGHAYVVYPFSHMEEFRAYERQARENGLGLWGATEAKAEPGQARAPTEGLFVGSSQSNKYHRLNCVWAQKIGPANLVTFKSPRKRRAGATFPVRSASRRPLQVRSSRPRLVRSAHRVGRRPLLATTSSTSPEPVPSTTSPGAASVLNWRSADKTVRCSRRFHRRFWSIRTVCGTPARDAAGGTRRSPGRSSRPAPRTERWSRVRRSRRGFKGLDGRKGPSTYDHFA